MDTMWRSVLGSCLSVLMISVSSASPTRFNDCPFVRLIACECYSVDHGGADAIRLRVHGGVCSLGKYTTLFAPGKDDIPLLANPLGDDEEVLIRVGECLFIEEACFGPTAIYALCGADIPDEMNCPEAYRRAPLLVGYAKNVIVADKIIGYLVCPGRNRVFRVDTGVEEVCFWPFRSTNIPQSGYAPSLPGAPTYTECWHALDDASYVMVESEADFPRLKEVKVLAKVRVLDDGKELVLLPARVPQVTNCCAVVRKTPDSQREVIAVAEVNRYCGVVLRRYDENGRLRWEYSRNEETGTGRAFTHYRRFPGDGTVDFVCYVAPGGRREAFAFRDRKAATVPDDERLGKLLQVVDDKFRKLFGFEGAGALTVEQIKKGIE